MGHERTSAGGVPKLIVILPETKPGPGDDKPEVDDQPLVWAANGVLNASDANAVMSWLYEESQEPLGFEGEARKA